MATLPEGLDTIFRSRTQAARQILSLKEIRNFQAYCCDINSDGIMGVAKDPVIVADINPNPICLGSDLDWDIGDSYAPGSTLTSWEVDFGDDTTPASGVDFPIDTTSGSHTYATEEDFVITITIYEGAGPGRSQTLEQTVSVIDCTTVLDYAYISFYGSGVYFIDFTAAALEWIAVNNGLEGDALNVNSMLWEPQTKSLSRGSHILWIATDGGVYKSANGGVSWSKMTMGDPSNSEFVGVPVITEDQLKWIDVKLGKKEDTVYVLASYTS